MKENGYFQNMIKDGTRISHNFYDKKSTATFFTTVNAHQSHMTQHCRVLGNNADFAFAIPIYTAAIHIHTAISKGSHAVELQSEEYQVYMDLSIQTSLVPASYQRDIEVMP